MGSFTQHVTCSTVTGIVLGGIAYHTGFSIPTCLLAGGLCSVAGMLPDIDSDTSRSFQECIYLAAGLATILWVHRLLQFNLSQDIVVLNGAGIFLFVRYAVGGFVKKATAHRGMIHSIPAAFLAGEILFFISAGSTPERLLKAFALTLGYLSHLALDEYCSIDSTGRRLRLKKSFGTALKFFDRKRIPGTLVLYALVIFLGLTAIKKPEIVENLDQSEALMAAESPLTEQEKNSSRFLSAWNERRVAIQQEAADFLARRRRTGSVEQTASPTPTPKTTAPRLYAEQLPLIQKANEPSLQIPVEAISEPPQPVLVPQAVQTTPLEMIGSEFVPREKFTPHLTPLKRKPATVKIAN